MFAWQGAAQVTCDFTFNMTDSYGDGWNGWTYDFVQNGVVISTQTLASGSSGTATVTLEDGVACDVVVNTAGSYGSEVSFDMTDASGTSLASISGATGLAGDVAASFMPSCGPPAVTCDFTFNMVDSYGDGWNGWAYDFVQNGVVVGSGTLASGSSGAVTVT
ncbi:MAG: hypothetical protein CL844_06550, partial [Crocinitomicaceae bacterium]|nr:hypothetical protein [Crocinitomicaceae bacterium]